MFVRQRVCANVRVQMCVCMRMRVLSQEEAVEGEDASEIHGQDASEIHGEDAWEDAWDMGAENSYPPTDDSKVQFATDHFDAGCSWTIHSMH